MLGTVQHARLGSTLSIRPACSMRITMFDAHSARSTRPCMFSAALHVRPAHACSTRPRMSDAPCMFDARPPRSMRVLHARRSPTRSVRPCILSAGQHVQHDPTCSARPRNVRIAQHVRCGPCTLEPTLHARRGPAVFDSHSMFDAGPACSAQSHTLGAARTLDTNPHARRGDLSAELTPVSALVLASVLGGVGRNRRWR